jgi:hypothetical protein
MVHCLAGIDTWNEEAVRLAWDEQTPLDKKGMAVYAASKTEGERQSWKWVQEHRHSFVFNTVLPSFSVRYPAALGGHDTDRLISRRLGESSTRKSLAQPWAGHANC